MTSSSFVSPLDCLTSFLGISLSRAVSSFGRITNVPKLAITAESYIRSWRKPPEMPEVCRMPALITALWCFHTRARQRQDNDKKNVEPVHSYDAFHTRSDMSGVKGIIGMHRFNICLVVVLSLSCSGVKTPLDE